MPGLFPKKVQRREFEYIRHGTQSLIVNPDVVTGQVVSPTCGDTCTEKDFANHIKGTIDCDSEATGWHIVMDGPNTHKSETLVRKWLKRASFTSKEDLKTRLLEFL